MLVMSIAAYAGHLELSPGFAWIGSMPALIAFSGATLLELGAYYIPWLDNLLDTIATPAAVVAGIVVTASMVTDVSPFLRWTLAVIAGGGIAGAVQSTTAVVRAASTGTTFGILNPVIASMEFLGAIVVSIASVLAPMLALGLAAAMVAVIAFGFRSVFRAWKQDRSPVSA